MALSGIPSGQVGRKVVGRSNCLGKTVFDMWRRARYVLLQIKPCDSVLLYGHLYGVDWGSKKPDVGLFYVARKTC
jgi:hypothetical protein